MKSILEPPSPDQCYNCGRWGCLEEHHIFYGRKTRKKAEGTGLKVHLCPECHRRQPTGVHGGNWGLELKLKEIAQAEYQKTHTNAEFIQLFGKNYIDQEGKSLNKAILMGRLTKDPETRYTTGDKPIAITKYTLAIDKRGRQQDQTADFINVVAFDKNGEFAEKYFRQGIRVLISGRIQTSSYTNKAGQKVYTTDVIVEEQEFADSKKTGPAAGVAAGPDIGQGFMRIEDGLETGLPFN